MAVSRKFIASLKSALAAEAKPSAAPKMQAYMKSAMPYYGVNAPTLKALCRDLFQAQPLDGYDRWRDTALALWRGAKFREERYCAIALCNARQYLQHQTLDSLDLYEEFIVSGAWWDLVDSLAPYRLGHLLTEQPKAMKPLLKQWARDENIWKRRSAILAQLHRKGEMDLTLLYSCIEPSLSSKEFFLQKAIGWALRDYAWHDPSTVVTYVTANEARLSPLSRREALKNIAAARTKRRAK